jgi:plastocyanin
MSERQGHRRAAALRFGRVHWFVWLSASAGLLGACGGGGDDGGSTGATIIATNAAVTVTAPGGSRFDVATINAEPGDLTVTFRNSDSQAHDFKVRDADDNPIGGAADPGPGDTANATFPLEAGTTYKFYCSKPGHEAQGMRGTIVVG